MQPFEYLLLLAAVILGLAIADLAVSLNRLLRAGRRVKWDWLAPLAALVALTKIVTQWWIWFGVQQDARSITFEMFLWVLLVTLVLFLLAAASLPDEVPEEGIELRRYFDQTGRYFFCLFALHSTGAFLVSIWIQVQVQNHFTDFLTWRLLLPAAMIGSAVSGALISNRWWRGACLVTYLGVYLWQSAGTSLTG